MHGELVHDIRVGWDAGWNDLGQRSLDLGELRELWDSDPSVRMPGVLLEVAYHDHPGDTDALKEPAFNRLAARAVYQGIVKYFEGRDSVDLTLLPEPPTRLRLINLGQSKVRVSWEAPSPDTSGLGGDAATGYRVYTSTTGVGWSNGSAVTGSTVFTLTDLEPGKLLFVRVTATNDGGESFPTETLATRVGDHVGVLLVNGFDRLNRWMLVPDYYAPTAEVHMRMFLDQMNRFDYPVHHGSVINDAFDGASNEAVANGTVSLGDYQVVDWIVGEEAKLTKTLGAAERTALRTYLDGDGALFISGSELAWDLDAMGRDPVFYNTYLHADYAGDDAGTYQVAPVTGGIFEGLAGFRFDAVGEYDADYPDQLTPLVGAQSALAYQGGSGGVAAVQYADGCGRVVNFGFPFETIHAGDRGNVMGRVIDFLDECLYRPPQTAITTPGDGATYEGVPGMAGNAQAFGGVTHVDVSLQREADGEYWDGTTWGAEAWQVAVGTEAWSFPMPATAELGAYTARARAWDTSGISDTTPAEARFFVLEQAAFLPLVLRRLQIEPVVCTDVLVNGGFETDAGWRIMQVSYPAAYTTTMAYAGTRSARVGIPSDRPGGGAVTYSAISQTIALPSGHSAMLKYRVYPVYEDIDEGDKQYAWLVDAYGETHFLHTSRDNLMTWVAREVDMSAFAGQTVSLRFSVKNDGDNDTAVTYLDDVRVWVCPP